MATAASILDLVQDMPATVSGLLLFGSEARSSVGLFVCGHSIVWGAATRDRRTLTSYLRQRAGLDLDGPALDEIYRSCRESHAYLGEELAARGAIGRDGLREALLAQAVDALCALDEVASSPYFVPSRREPPSDRLSVDELRGHLGFDAAADFPPGN